MSSKEDKKAEKARLKAQKEAEKAAKKAEKERIAAEKKAKKAARKSGAPVDSMDRRNTGKSLGAESTISENVSPAKSISDNDPASAVVDRPVTTPTPEPESETQSPKPLNPIDDNGVGFLAQAWMKAPQINWKADDPTSVHMNRNDFDEDHHVQVGEGHFGMIFETKVARSGVFLDRDEGTSEQLSVVVKTLSSTSSAEMRTAFLQEASVMESVDHECVLRCLGSISESDPLWIVYENHGNGDLKSYLYNSRNSGIPHSTMASFALSIARGLEFLHIKSVVHKDLAARNCLVTADNTPIARIGDYGLSRVRFPNDYSVLSDLCQGSLPVRWMPPESLASLELTSASDMWSFGVTMWEILAHGNQPYSTLSTSEVPKFVSDNGQLKIKSEWPDSLKNLLSELTKYDPKERLNATSAVEKLKQIVEDLEPKPTFESPAKAQTDTTDSNSTLAPQSIDGSDEASIFKKLATSRKSFRSLGTFKDAESPADALESAGIAASSAKELSRDKLTVEGELGQGAFGVVVKGKLTMDDGSIVPCACKTLKDTTNAESLDALLAEAELVAGFDHANVVACYGQLTKESPAMIVFEFMSNGSLFGYLQDLPELPRLQRLMQMAIDTGKGMAHLEEKNFIHRDLATRNVLVAEDLTCKISDFGLSRDLDDDTYYESEGGMVPIRWTPPEAYKYKKYSTASDVWSYGITLYEIWTKGAIPYGKKWTNMNVMLNVEKGFRLPPPEGCPKPVYQLMMQCWNPRRKMRPTFASIKDRLEMAYDMLFPDEVEDPNEVAIGDQDYGDLEQIYLGVDVPTEDNLDEEVYLTEPTPVVKAPTASQLAKELDDAKKPKTYVGADVGMKPDRFSKDVFSLLGKASPSSAGSDTVPSPQMLRKTGGAGTPPTSKPDRFANVVKPDRFAHVGKKSDGANKNEEGVVTDSILNIPSLTRGSLRKQKGTEEEDDDKVAYTSSAKVAQVLAMSREKETQSYVEQAGVAKVVKMGINVAPPPSNAYVETVGRAVDVKPLKEGVAKGRKRCVCRRFKCVCGFK